MNLKPYLEYKESGVPWLGLVPEGWEVNRLGSVFFERKEKVSDKDYPPLSVTKNGILPQLETAAKTNDGDNRKKVCAGDFVINSRSDRKGSSGLSPLTGSVSLINTVLIPSGITGKYAHRLLKNSSFIEEFYRVGRGIVADLWSTKYSDMRTIMIPIPSPSEQIQIARFLDRKTSQITRFIKAKKRMIELLKEQKNNVIENAVVNGIDQSCTFKPSGVSWLGDIPAHWAVKRIKYVLQEVDIRSSTGKETFLSLRMYHGIVIFSEHFNRPPQAATLVGFKIVEPGQIVLNRMQAGNGVIFPSSLFGIVSPDYAVFKPLEDVNVDYLGELFRSRKMRGKFRSESKGLGTGTSGFLRLYNDRFGSIHIPLPPRSEQDRILAGLHEKLSNLNATISRFEREISLMQEYRDRLIADVVTGKVDVRAIDVPEVVEEETVSDEDVSEEEIYETEEETVEA